MDHPCSVSNATRLFSTRNEVSKVNVENFSKLRTPVVTYQTLDGLRWNGIEPHLEHYSDRLPDGSLAALQDHRLEQLVELRVGMLVVLQVNLDLGVGLCNGSQGIICGFEDFDPAKLPRAPGNAHDHQGPRPTSPSAVGVNIIYGDHAVLKEGQIRRFTHGQEQNVWPRVLFRTRKQGSIKRTIYAACVVNAVGNQEPYSLLHRTQIPLVAGWAMSIHKSQEMTLDRVLVDLTRAFEEGQVYVALSRATCLEGLKVEGSAEGLAVGRGGNPDVRHFLRQKLGPGLLRQLL